MATVHFMQFSEPNKPGLCSIGLKTNRNFSFTRKIEEVTCKSCVQKLMKFSGDTNLYKQAYPPPYIGL